jgi:hypothetical protein
MVDIISESIENNSLNPGGIMEEEDYEKEYKYRGRIGRICTINANPSKENKFYKVIIPYNFDKKKYTIKKKEIAFWENKNYLLDKLEKFCNIPAFNIEKEYQATKLQKFTMYLPVVFICLILIYIVLVLAALFSFNPILLYTLYSWIKKGFHKLQMFKFILLEKWKIVEINKILEKENYSEFCIENKLKWKLGQSGYWIEIQKLI